MTKEGKGQYREVLKDYISDLEEEGYRVIPLEGKSPDAIAIKLDASQVDIDLEKIKVCAVDVLGKTHRKGRGYHGSWTYKQKKKTYSMFDDVLIRTFKRDTNYTKGGPPLKDDEK